MISWLDLALSLMGYVVGLLTGAIFLGRQFKTQDKAHERTLLHLCGVAESAMGHVKATTLEEKLVGDVRKKEYDSRLEYMRDQMHRGVEAQKQRDTKPEKKLVRDEFSGSVVDLNEYDLLG